MKEIIEGCARGPDGICRLTLFGNTVEVNRLLSLADSQNNLSKQPELFTNGADSKLASAFRWSEPSPLEVEQAIRSHLKRSSSELRKEDQNNPFGSKWGEITAKIAAQQLGWPEKRVLRELSRIEPSPAKTEQGIASAVLEKWILGRLGKRGAELVRAEKIQTIIQSWTLLARREGCSQGEARDVANCLAQLQIIQEPTGKIVNSPSLLRLLSRGRKGEVVELTKLHCLPRKIIAGEARLICGMREITNNRGGTCIIDQGEELRGLLDFSNVMDRFQIKNTITFILVDIDPSILDQPNLEGKIELFMKEFRGVASTFFGEVKVVRASQELGPKAARDILKKERMIGTIRNPEELIGFKHWEQMVNHVFEKMKMEWRWPKERCTREAARKLAAQELATEIIFGENFSRRSRVFVQRATTRHASDLFLVGAKQVGERPSFLFCWNERENAV